jgi:ribonuclease P protein component
MLTFFVICSVRFTLSKIEKLKKEIQIKSVFQSGLKSSKYPIRANWNFLDIDTEVKVLFGAPKKNIKAAPHRNKVKRLLREAYRLNKHALIEVCLQRNVKIGVSFIYIGNEIPTFEYISTKMILLLEQLIVQIEENT